MRANMAVIWGLVAAILAICESTLATEYSESANVTREKRTFIKDEKYRWTKAVLPYIIEDDVTNYPHEDLVNEIDRSMQTYRRFTCLEFVPREKTHGQTTNDKLGLGHPGFLRFHRDEGRCNSLVGNQRWVDGQKISCCGGMACLHEIGHALGFPHEHQSPNPDRNRFIRINNKNLDGEGPMWYRQLEQERFTWDEGYDLSSNMHYNEEHFTNKKGPSYNLLFPELDVARGFFYMMKEVSDKHKCQDRCHDTTLSCENDGYLTKANGKCQCVCPPGLDPATGCTKTRKKDAPGLQFPGGKYALPAHSQGCPNGEFHTGYRTQHNDGENAHSKVYDLKGDVGQTVEQHFCVKSAPENDFKWPAGTYCIYRRGGSCPDGFKEGSVEYADRSTTNQQSTAVGTLPDGVFTGDKTTYKYCCKDTGFPHLEIDLPSNKPFALLKLKYKTCQKVRGMHIDVQSFMISNRLNDEGTIPSWNSWKYPAAYKTDVCVYKPAMTDCGAVLELSASNPEVTFESPRGQELECYWLLKAPEGQRLALDFTSFDIAGTPGDCQDDLEVRYLRPGEQGLNFCGKSWDKTTISIRNMIHMRLSTYGDSDSHFSAKVRLIKDEDLCYRRSDYGTYYAGDVTFTRDFEPCLPWSEMIHCEDNPFRNDNEGAALEGSKCRSPRQASAFQPWCYTNKEQCMRNYCDVCLLEQRYDTRTDCAELKASGNCVFEGCAKTCADVFPKPSAPVKASDLSCGPPTDVPDGVRLGALKSSYAVGEKVTYKCKHIDSTKDKMCLTSGEWTPLGTVCAVCKDGAIHNEITNTCYEYFAEMIMVSQAKKNCKDKGGKLATPKTDKEKDILKSLIKAHIWIDLNDLDTEGSFVWGDGQPLDDSPDLWIPGAPDNQWDNEHCVEYDSGLFKFNDYPCDYGKAYVCEMPADSGNLICADRNDRCPELLQETPSMCGDFPEYAKENCRYTCGKCDRDSTPKCPVKLPGGGYRPPVSRGETVRYACRDGELPVRGHTARGCQASGELAGTELECKPNPCPSGWTFRKTKNICHKLFEERMTYFDAKYGCEKLGGSLPVFKDDADYEYYVQYTSPEQPWIGLDNIRNQPRLVFHWADGTPLTFAKWQGDAPGINNDAPNELCVVYTGEGRLMATSCGSHITKPYFCEVPPSAFDKQDKKDEATKIHECEAGWSLNPETKFCYKFFGSQWNTYSEAEDTCAKENSILTTIHSKEEQRFVNSLRGDSWTWIGLDDRTTESKFEWIDKSPVGFQLWAPGEPNNYKSGEDCTVIINSDGKWWDFPCNTHLNFVCKTYPTVKTLTCEDGWSLNSANNNCYKLSDERKPYAEARADCQSLGGDLATAKDPTEQDLVYRLGNQDWIWLGLDDLQEESKFVWVDGSAANYYRNWSPGEPNNWGGDEDCALMLPAEHEGRWFDYNCKTVEIKYVCKVPVKGAETIEPNNEAVVVKNRPTFIYPQQDKSLIDG